MRNLIEDLSRMLQVNFDLMAYKEKIFEKVYKDGRKQ
jgi:hypothetical protein